MPVFFYQSKVQPVSTLKESVTVDRWLPTWPQPLRPERGVAPAQEPILLAPASVKPLPFSAATFPETVTEDRWHATYRQPDRTRRYATGDTFDGPVAPVVVADLSYQWLAGVAPQPKRVPSYARGTELVAPVAPVADLSYQWLAGVVPQPKRLQKYAPGTGLVAPFVTVAPGIKARHSLSPRVGSRSVI